MEQGPLNQGKIERTISDENPDNNLNKTASFNLKANEFYSDLQADIERKLKEFDKFDRMVSFTDSNEEPFLQRSDKMKEYFKSQVNLTKINAMKRVWKENYFVIILFVKSFVNKMKNKIPNSKFDIGPKYLLFINDKSYFFYEEKNQNDKYKENSKLKKFWKIFRRALQSLKKFLFQHIQSFFSRQSFDKFFSETKQSISRSIKSGKFQRNSRIIWDGLIFWVILLEICYIPMFVSFNLDLEGNDSDYRYFEGPQMVIFENLSIIIFIFDIIFNFSCGYYKKGLFVSEQPTVFYHYLKKKFWIDSITLIFLTFPFWFGASRYYALIFMLNVVKINNIRRKFLFFFNNNSRIAIPFKLASLSFTVIFLSHLFACAWYLLAIIELSYDKNIHTWVHTANLELEPWYYKYIYSFYYSIVTIVTVGYGDVTPQNPWERLASCFFIIVGCFAFGYFINCIGSIFQEMSHERNSFIESIAEIDLYMRKRNVDFDLQIRVRHYLEWVFKEESESREKEKEILKPLSKNLREEVLYQVYGKRIKSIFIFDKYFTNEFLNVLSLKIREVSFVPEEIIFKQNQAKNQGFYFIDRGEVELLLFFDDENYDNQLSFAKLQHGDTFGISYFLTAHPERYSSKSLTLSKLLYLDRGDLIQTLNDFPEDKEVFMFLKDKHQFYKHNSEFGIVCFCCLRSDHSVFTCPFIHLKVDKKHVIMKKTYSQSNIRTAFIRKKKKSFHALKKKKLIESEFCKFSFEKYYESRKKNRFKDAINRLESYEEEEEKESVYNLHPMDTFHISHNEPRFDFQENDKSKNDNEINVCENINEEESGSVSGKSSMLVNRNSVLFEAQDTQNDINYKEEIRLDIMKSYRFYFPHNNVENMVKFCSTPSILITLKRKNKNNKKKAVRFMDESDKTEGKTSSFQGVNFKHLFKSSSFGEYY